MKFSDLISDQNNTVQQGDNFAIELDYILLESYVVGFTKDGIVLHGDDTLLSYLNTEEVSNPIVKFSEMDIAIMEGGGSLDEAEYQGRNVPLGKRMPGDVKKSKVYVRKPNGKVVKVNFGDKKMRIKKSNPDRRKSFRARHHCENPGPRWKARYWSCKAW